MTKTRLFSLLMIPIIIVLGYLLFDGVNSTIQLAKAIEKSENKVRDKLKIIREAEKAFLSSKGYYTDNWDTLIDFINNGVIYNVEKKEIIQPRTADDPLYYTGEDSVRVEFDTLDSSNVLTAIFPAKKYPNFVPEDIMYIPGKDGKKFDIFAGKVEKSNVTIDVIEVVDKYPMDKSRKEDNPAPQRRFLRFGSKSEASTSGNWE